MESHELTNRRHWNSESLLATSVSSVVDSSAGPQHTSDDGDTSSLIPSSRDKDVEYSSDFLSEPPPYGNWRSSLDALLRSFGLTLLLATRPLKWLGYDSTEEQKKVAIEQSYVKACIRCLVHVLPVTGVVLLLWLNFTSFYVGPEIRVMVGLQFAAKIHELMMVASLGTAVCSYLRYQLTLGEGLTFGAIFAGLQITQMAYLWSPEMWGSISSSCVTWRNKIPLLLVVGSALVLASTVGPSSATCMIPRPGYWPAGTAYIKFNGTVDDLYPTFIHADGVSPSRVNSSYIQGSKRCPSYGWQVLPSAVYESGPRDAPREMSTIMPSIFSTKRTAYTMSAVMYPQLTPGRSGGSSNPFSVSTTRIQATAPMWPLMQFDRATQEYSYTMDAMDSYASVHCSHEVQLNASASLGHPTNIVSFEFWNGTTTEIAGYANVSYADIEGQITLGKLNLLFVPLQQMYSNTTSTGMMVVDARTSPWLLVTPCSVDAGWLPATAHWNSSANTAAIWSDSTNYRTRWYPATSQDPVVYDEWSIPRYLRRVNASAEFFRFINPTIPVLNATTFDVLMSQVVSSGGFIPGYTYASLGSSLISIGLSNVPLAGSAGLQSAGRFVPNGNPHLHWDVNTSTSTGRYRNFDAFDREHTVLLQAQAHAYGLAYGTSATAVRLALAILLLYSLVALVHTCYSLRSGVSSASWDSMAEMMALGINSRPTERLQNTCAGIRSIEVLKERVKIIPTPGPGKQLEKRDDQTNWEHLEMIFLRDNEDAVADSVRKNAYYGAC